MHTGVEFVGTTYRAQLGRIYALPAPNPARWAGLRNYGPLGLGDRISLENHDPGIPQRLSR
jgi:hypothetical protein